MGDAHGGGGGGGVGGAKHQNSAHIDKGSISVASFTWLLVRQNILLLMVQWVEASAVRMQLKGTLVSLLPPSSPATLGLPILVENIEIL